MQYYLAHPDLLNFGGSKENYEKAADKLCAYAAKNVAAVLEITAAETDVDATLSGSCCFYAAVAAAMAASADLPQKVRKQRGVYAPLFSFWKNSFFFFSLFSSSLSCLITSVFLFLYTFFIYFIYSIPVDHQSAIHNEPPFRKWTPKPFKSTSSYYNICMK